MNHKTVKQFRQDSLYQQNYPNYLSWNKTKWILKPTDIIHDKETSNQYEVTSIKLIPVPGVPPQIEVKSINTNEHD